MKKLIALISIAMLYTACSQNTNRQEFTKTENSSSVAAITPKQSAAGMKLTKPTELLPEITEKYSGIKIMVSNKKDGSKMEVSIPFSRKTPIGNSGLEITASSYFTSFTMVDGGVRNMSMDENNPAAKVMVADNGSQIFDGWLFQEYPDMHPFEHPTWKIVLIGAVRK